jgi:hypothetical protein
VGTWMQDPRLWQMQESMLSLGTAARTPQSAGAAGPHGGGGFERGSALCWPSAGSISWRRLKTLAGGAAAARGRRAPAWRDQYTGTELEWGRGRGRWARAERRV